MLRIGCPGVLSNGHNLGHKWALPSGAKEQIGPKGRSRAPGTASILRNISKNKEIGPIPRMVILRFVRPGHPSYEY